MKIGTLQALACVGLGTLIGFFAATRDTSPSARADGATSPARQAGAAPSVEKTLCCSDGLARNVLLARADAETVKAPPTQAGKKPNIVFIMGDDVGWFNIGAYHRGMMGGKTPNLDRLASQGMLFTDYYAEPSCTAGAGELHHRSVADPDRPHHRRPGRRQGRDARGGPDHRHGAQVDGLRHRPVRQEPPGRPQRVSPDGPRVRRVLRLPIPPRRDGGPRLALLPAGAEGQGSAPGT